MNFLFGLFIFFASIWLIFRLFGKQILTFVLQKVVNKAMKSMEEQSQQYERNYSQDPYHDRHTVDSEMEIKIPKTRPESPGPSLEEVAEDVDFEEVEEIRGS